MEHSVSSEEISLINKERTVFHSLIIDLILWIPDIIAAIASGSVTMLADVVKCGNEILATFLAWLVLRKLSRDDSGTYDYGMGKFENITGLLTGVVMFISLILVFYSGIERLFEPEPINTDGALLGIFLMFIGMCVNTRLWYKNHQVAKKDPSPIMESQTRLFRTKAISDTLVFLTLVASLTLQEFWWSRFFDPVSSFIIGIFLFFSGYHVIKSSLQDLLDKTIDESFQLIILQDLAHFFNEYTEFHGIRSRRSGNNIYIEIFLEFDGNRKMCEIQDVIDRMKYSIEKKIKRSSISIVPSSNHCETYDK